MSLTIATHDGMFHTDEVLAVAALLMLYPDAEIVRTRNPEKLATADIRVDVGGKYDPATGDYDHHQREGAPEPRPNGIKYSSFGLVWQEKGVEITQDVFVANGVDKILAMAVDARDNGQQLVAANPEFGGARPYEFAEMINSLNPFWDESADPDVAFGIAVDLASMLLRRLIGRLQSVRRAEQVVKKAIDTANATDPRVIVLPIGCPWGDVIQAEAPEAKLVIVPSGTNWNIQAIRTRPEPGAPLRLAFPAEWAGLRDDVLANVTGNRGAIFAHRDRHLVVTSSLEGALYLAGRALEPEMAALLFARPDKYPPCGVSSGRVFVLLHKENPMMGRTITAMFVDEDLGF